MNLQRGDKIMIAVDRRPRLPHNGIFEAVVRKVGQDIRVVYKAPDFGFQLDGLPIIGTHHWNVRRRHEGITWARADDLRAVDALRASEALR